GSIGLAASISQTAQVHSTGSARRDALNGAFAITYPLVMCDNRITQHSSVCDHRPHRRHMQHFTEVQR
ncbi:hypothetical protein N9E47_06960, partial [Luminiphilus sp.]|nr:hypothetical protein [Luminiphilus sp.]